MALTLVTAPAIEPVTLAEAKSHFRVVNADDDTYINMAIAAARDYVENFTHHALIEQTLEQRHDVFPAAIETLRSPLISVTSIQYIDTAGATQTLVTSEYTVDAKSEPGRIAPAYGKTWPSTQAELNAVTVTYKAGYGTSAQNVPDQIRWAMLLIAGELYQRRETALVGAAIREVPLSAKALLGPYIVPGF